MLVVQFDEYHGKLRARLRRIESERAARSFEGLAPVPGLFAGKDVLVTGASGFLGRVLIEKLLRSCPDIGNVYLLLRPKRGVPALQRVRDIVDVPVREAQDGLA